MQTADHVNFGYAETECFRDRADNFVNCVLKRVRIAFLGRESAELAGEDANVRVVNVTVVDVSGAVPIFPLAHNVGHDSKVIEIVRAI